MTFSSLTFISIFLPLVLIINSLIRKSYSNFILLIASWIFYAWFEFKFLIILICVIVINWLGGFLIFNGTTIRKKAFLIFLLLLNLGILIYFKYSFFFNQKLSIVSNNFFIGMALPIAMSFYIFKAISYNIDIYRGMVSPQSSFIKISLYLSMFPTLTIGPLVKYHEFYTQLNSEGRNQDQIILGIKRFIIGFSKKVLIADVIKIAVSEIFNTPVIHMPPSVLWAGAIGAGLQLYYDFSGYSDMAIGLGLMLGFKIPENFNYPFMSRSIQEYWQRWHITMSLWFKEYLFFPLMRSSLVQIIERICSKNFGQKLSRKMVLYFSLFIFWSIVGLWHGTNWSIVIGTGIIHAFYIVSADIFKPLSTLLKNKMKINEDCLLWRLFQNLHTIVLLLISYVFFASNDVSHGIEFISEMFSFTNSNSVYQMANFFNTKIYLAYLIAIFLSFPIFKNLIYTSNKKTIIEIVIYCWLFVLFILSMLHSFNASYSPFLYFKFS